MRACDVADVLHIDKDEFSRIEPSIATALNLKQNAEGEFLYSKENITDLRKLFEEAIGGAPDESEILNSLPLSIPVTEAKSYSWEKITNKAKPKRVVRAKDVLRRITRDGSSALRHVKEDQTPNLTLEKIEKLLHEQKDFIEEKLAQKDAESQLKLEKQLMAVKKENLKLKGQIETLNKIINSQNEDKRYLIAKINQKYSLWNIIQWKQQRNALNYTDSNEEFSS